MGSGPIPIVPKYRAEGPVERYPRKGVFLGAETDRYYDNAMKPMLFSRAVLPCRKVGKTYLAYIATF